MNKKFEQLFNDEIILKEEAIKYLRDTAKLVELTNEKKENAEAILEDLNEKYEKFLNIIDKSLEIFIKNQSNFDIIIGISGFISPFLVYRTLLSGYSKFMSTPTNQNNTFTALEIEKLLKQRTNLIRKFKYVSIPIISLFTIFTYQYKLNTEFLINKTDNNETSFSFLFLIKKITKNNKYLVYFIPILTLIL
jgi:hypothetical protein